MLNFFQGRDWKRTDFLKKSGRLGPFGSPRNKFPPFGTGHSLIQIHFSALWVKRLTPFLDPKRTNDPLASYRWVIFMTVCHSRARASVAAAVTGVNRGLRFVIFVRVHHNCICGHSHGHCCFFLLLTPARLSPAPVGVPDHFCSRCR